MSELQNLRDDPDFTLKELYRRHNFAENNIGKRKAAKIKDGPPILSAASANDATESTHSSLSNTIDVPERAHLDEGIGSFSEVNKETTESTHSSSSNTLDVPERDHLDDGIGSFSELLNWFSTHCAGHHESPQTHHCSMLRIASWAMQEVNGVFLQGLQRKPVLCISTDAIQLS